MLRGEGGEPQIKIGFWHGFGKKIALAILAAFFEHGLGLLLRFDAFGNGAQFKVRSHSNYGVGWVVIGVFSPLPLTKARSIFRRFKFNFCKTFKEE